MRNSLPPLHYAIIKCFDKNNALRSEDVMASLEQDYSDYKLFSRKDIDEVLATAKENGLLEECEASIDDKGQLCISYRMTDFGKNMVQQYL